MLIATIFNAVLTALTLPRPLRVVKTTADYLLDMQILDAAITCKEQNISARGPYIWKIDALTNRFDHAQLLTLYRRAEAHWIQSNPLCQNYPRSARVQILNR